jgi:hypothetical protein
MLVVKYQLRVPNGTCAAPQIQRRSLQIFHGTIGPLFLPVDERIFCTPARLKTPPLLRAGRLTMTKRASWLLGLEIYVTHKLRLRRAAAMKSIVKDDKAAGIYPLQSSYSRRRIIRGPALWVVGLTALGCSTVTLSGLASPGAAAFLVAACILCSCAWTCACIAILWNDVYKTLLLPRLQTAVGSASQWSLDDALRILWDPTQLAAGLTTCILLPTTLYTLPTTPEQRTRVLEAAGLLSPVDNLETSAATVLTSKGGWRHLLPTQVQEFLCRVEKIDDHHSTGSRKPMLSGESNHRLDQRAMSDDESTDDDSEPPLTSHSKPMDESTSSDSTPSQQKSARADDELPDLVLKIVREMIARQMDQFCDTLQRHKNISMLTAAVATAILTIQMRKSSRARAMCYSVLHLATMTTAGTVALSSVVALAAPYLYRQGDVILQGASMFRSQNPKRDAQCVKLLLRSLLDSLTQTISQTFHSDSSLPTKLAKILVHWKGAVAVWVLAYFQYRRSRQKLHAK